MSHRTDMEASIQRVLQDLRREYIRTWEQVDKEIEVSGLLRIQCGDLIHALRLSDMQQLDRVPEIVPLPQAPPPLLGLMADAPDLVDQVCALAYEPRRAARMRQIDE